jgi:hypothetical protein
VNQIGIVYRTPLAPAVLNALFSIRRPDAALIAAADRVSAHIAAR